MAREAALPGERTDNLDDHEGDREYQRSPEGELEAREYWALTMRICGGSREPDPWHARGRQHPEWYYLWL